MICCFQFQKEIEAASDNGGDRNWHPSHYGNRKKKASPSKVSSVIKKCPRCDYSTPKKFNIRTHIMSMHLGRKVGERVRAAEGGILSKPFSHPL